MKRLKAICICVIVIIAFLLLIELTVPAAKGFTYGILHMFWPTLREFYLVDWIWSVVLFIIGAIFVFGTVHISKRSENRIWAVVTGIVSIVSFFSMFVVAPGRK